MCFCVVYSQIGTPWFDGTEGVTQCPIVPGDTFKYQFVVDRVSCSSGFKLEIPDFLEQFADVLMNLQPGTYLYHAHYGMQREAGLYGSIRVSPPAGQPEPFAYNYDRSIILTDWYHNSTYEQSVGLSSIPFVWVGEPHVSRADSFLVQC